MSPAALAASDPGSAVLRSNGGVWVNGTEVVASIVIFPGDLVETRPGFVANLDAEGSSVLVQSESVVKFQGNYLDLEHGGVSVGTSTLMSVHIKCMRIEPVAAARTQYDVIDRTGAVHVAARKNDVNIKQSEGLRKPAAGNSSAQSATVHEGEQTTRDETTACGAAERPEGPGHALNTKWIEIGGGAAGGVIALCLILCRGSSPSSVSPSNP